MAKKQTAADIEAEKAVQTGAAQTAPVADPRVGEYTDMPDKPDESSVAQIQIVG